MPHDTSLITTIVAALVLAYVFGAIAHRLRMPPLVGYLIAGICVGPHSPGFIADQTLAPQLAEIGVILLMFGVGLQFSLRDLLSVKAIAVPGALLRMVVATGLGLGLAMVMGWPIGGGIVFGLALSVSSTVVLLKALQDRHIVDSERGRIAVGWLIVEDLAMVLALVLIPALAGVMGGGAAAAGAIANVAQAGASDPFVRLTEELFHAHLPLWGVLAVTVVKLLAFAGFMIVVGRRIIPAILHATAHTGSRELFRLAVLAIALGVAAGAAYLFGVSLALGAFFAGMILSESELSHRAAQETLPLRDAFGVLFFVSVGMLFDPSIIIREPLPVLATLFIVLFGKSLIGFLLLVLFRTPLAAALTITAALAQIGEFSFILAALGITLGLLPVAGQDLILAGAIFSIILNPAMFWLSERLRPRLEARTMRRSEPELGPIVPDHADEVVSEPVPEGEVLEEVAQPTHLSNHVVLIGYGRVGSVVASELLEEHQPFVLIEDGEDRVLKAREAGIEVIVANAATNEALRLANVMGARSVIIAIPNAFEAGQATEQARKLNAAVRILARAHSDEEVEYLRGLGADEVIMGEREIGLGMVGWLQGGARPRQANAAPRFAAAENVLQQARDTDRQPAEPEMAGGDGGTGTTVALAVPAALAVLAEPADLTAPAEASRERSNPALPAPAEPAAEARPELPPTIILPWSSAEHRELQAPATDSSVPATAQPAASEPLPAAPAPDAPSAGIASKGEDAAPPTPFRPAGFEEDAAPTRFETRAEPPAFAPVGSAVAAETAVRPSSSPSAAWSEPSITEPAAFEHAPGFRVVPADEIMILPPEPASRTGARAAAAGEKPDQPAAPFHSEFWAEPGTPGDEAPVHPIRDVQATEAARAAVEAGSWIAALENDLFGRGSGGARRADAAAPTETPPPPKEPMPQPEPPTEPPRQPEQPQPIPQPVEPARPQEVPVPPSPAAPVPPVTPEPRAGETTDAVDAFGRREPRLY